MAENKGNSGYRISAEKAERLRVAGVPLRMYSLQSILDFAVDEFLERHGSKDVNTGLNPANLGDSLTPATPSADRLMAVEMAIQEALVALSALRQPREPEKDGAVGAPAPPKHPGADRPSRKRASGQ